jgi:AraC-like DNA-binding protein
LGADGADLDGIATETVSDLRRRRVLAPAVSIDPRIATAVRDLAVTDSIGHLAAHVGLSQSRLRTLVQELTGVPPTRLRMWQRFRAAMLDLPDKPLALAAAEAGFADQAHMTRTAIRLVGWTPGELAREVDR